MSKETTAQLRAQLEALVKRPPRGCGEFPLRKSIDFRADMAHVNRVLANKSAPAEKLLIAYNRISQYYGVPQAAAPQNHNAMI